MLVPGTRPETTSVSKLHTILKRPPSRPSSMGSTREAAWKGRACTSPGARDATTMAVIAARRKVGRMARSPLFGSGYVSRINRLALRHFLPPEVQSKRQANFSEGWGRGQGFGGVADKFRHAFGTVRCKIYLWQLRRYVGIGVDLAVSSHPPRSSSPRPSSPAPLRTPPTPGEEGGRHEAASHAFPLSRCGGVGGGGRGGQGVRVLGGGARSRPQGHPSCTSTEPCSRVRACDDFHKVP